MIRFVFTITAIFLIGALMLFFVSLFVAWIIDIHFSYPKIKFKTFKKFYLINPNRWKLYSTIVGCLDESKYSYINGHYIELRFNYIDCIKYTIWKSILEYREENIKSTETMLRVIELVKKDIIKSEKLAQKRQNEALDNLDKILGGGIK